VAATFRRTPIVLACAVAAIFAVRARSVRVTNAAAPAANPSSRFVELDEITPQNVSRLTTAWTAHTGDFPGGSPAPKGAVEGFQTRAVLAGDLPGYQDTRDRLSADVAALTERIASYAWDLAELRDLLPALSRAMRPEVAALRALDTPTDTPTDLAA